MQNLSIQLRKSEEKGYMFSFSALDSSRKVINGIGIEALTNGKGLFVAELGEDQLIDFYKELGIMLGLNKDL